MLPGNSVLLQSSKGQWGISVISRVFTGMWTFRLLKQVFPGVSITELYSLLSYRARL